jgi:putative peptidoglycan lipid II flippase
MMVQRSCRMNRRRTEDLPGPEGELESFAAATAGDSLRISAWTLVSRLTGVLRLAAVGAVLGPTLLGNTFQFTNSLPNLIYYGFLGGSLFSSLLVPVLASLDGSDRRAAERLAGGFLGVALGGLTLAALVAVLVGPLLLRLGALGTQDAAVGAAQEEVGRLLLALLIPQVLAYAVVGTSTAVMNAHRRFALAAAAPALENVGILVVLGLVAVLYRPTDRLDEVPLSELVVLGVGATAAVGIHAAVQWWGARRVGIVLVPAAGWRDPEVTALVRRAMPALGISGVTALQMLLVLVLANRVQGGVIAAQIGLTFSSVIVALGATPVALALLPRLSRFFVEDDRDGFQDAWLRGVALTFFVTVPAAAGFLVLARPLAEVVAVGRMGSSAGVQLVATMIPALAPGIIGWGLFQVLANAFYARKDTRTPLRSMVVQAATFLVLAISALVVDTAHVLVVLGLSFSAANTVGVCHLAVRLRAGSDRVSGRLGSSVRRVVGGTAVMAVPAWAITVLVPSWIGGRAGWWIALITATLVGAAVFLLLQAWWRAPELTWLTGGLARTRGRDGGDPG